MSDSRAFVGPTSCTTDESSRRRDEKGAVRRGEWQEADRVEPSDRLAEPGGNRVTVGGELRAENSLMPGELASIRAAVGDDDPGGHRERPAAAVANDFDGQTPLAIDGPPSSR